MRTVEEKIIQISSIPENINKVEIMIDEISSSYSIHDELYGNMLIAVTEAVNNAIYHGNQCDETKLVTIAISAGEKKIIVIIEDEGAGFDPNSLADPTAPENIEKPSGRGVFLIKHLSDMVIFSNNGARLELQFHI